MRNHTDRFTLCFDESGQVSVGSLDKIDEMLRSYGSKGLKEDGKYSHHFEISQEFRKGKKIEGCLTFPNYVLTDMKKSDMGEVLLKLLGLGAKTVFIVETEDTVNDVQVNTRW